MNYFFTRSSLLFLISFSFSVKKSFNVVIVEHPFTLFIFIRYNTINVIIYASERERERENRACDFAFDGKEKKKKINSIGSNSFHMCVCVYIYTLQKKKKESYLRATQWHDTTRISNLIELKQTVDDAATATISPPPFFLFSSPLFIVVLTLDPFPIYRYSRKLIDIFRLKKYFSQPIES